MSYAFAHPPLPLRPQLVPRTLTHRHRTLHPPRHRPARPPHHRRPPCAQLIPRAPPPPPPPRRDPDDPDDLTNGVETVLSRRLFLLGTFSTSVVVTLTSYRYFVGDDIETHIRTVLARRFPQLFPPLPGPPLRANLDSTIATIYYDAFGQAAVRMKLLSLSELQMKENEVRERALSLFFPDEEHPPPQSFSDARWLNFLLYARLRALEPMTSPRTRYELADGAARTTLVELLKQGPSSDATATDAMSWRMAIESVLELLVSKGWIATWRIELFDNSVGSTWMEEGRMSFTVYAINPVTMQAAQLIGEEQYEEFSPKVSAFVKAVLVDAGLKVTFEDYYLDDVYRPDPALFKPTQLATQFDVSLS